VERYRFTIWDGDSFEYVGEWVYVSPVAAEAQAIQVAKELSEDDDTWHGGWISVENWRRPDDGFTGRIASTPKRDPVGGHRPSMYAGTCPGYSAGEADIKYWAATVERSIAVHVRSSDIDHSVAGRPASSLTTVARNRSSQR
jgi:hypothetical protein